MSVVVIKSPIIGFVDGRNNDTAQIFIMRGLKSNVRKTPLINQRAMIKTNNYIYGISVDSVPCKTAWAAAIGISETNLLADFWPHGEIAKKFRVFNKENGISGRVNILIGRDQTIEWVREYALLQITASELGR